MGAIPFLIDSIKRIFGSREVSRRELNELYKKEILIEEKHGKKYAYFINSKLLKVKVYKATHIPRVE